MRKAFYLFVFIASFTVTSRAQPTLAPTVVASAGAYSEGEHMTVSWTLGELAVTTLTGGNMMLTQGFQQPFDIGVGLEKENQVNWGISAYPNPVGEELRIRFDVEQTGDYLVEIQDVTGRLVSQHQYKSVHPGDVVVVNTSTYLEGIYFLKVLTPDRQQIQVTSLRKL